MPAREIGNPFPGEFSGPIGPKAQWEHEITVDDYGSGDLRTESWEQLDKDLVEIGMNTRGFS